ncbi:MAG: diguanylate cyclase [Deltaproteobacteria bacterium]|nr:MAG: diguanylate cyclase [Deltaproteobacteria bacterium]
MITGQSIMRTKMPYGKIWQRYSLALGFLVAAFTAGVFAFTFSKNEEFVRLELEAKAESYFDSIVLTRRWNAIHGGVFVKKSDGMESSPYLEKPDIETRDGQLYTKKNPALMTREMSEMAEHDLGCIFHITSLSPINPQNKPLPFEINMLKSFEQGASRAALIERHNGRKTFRFMAPLMVEKSCLACHAGQGYREGDIRGGISVSFDVSAVENQFIKRNIRWALLGFIGAGLFLGLFFKLTSTLKNKLQRSQLEIERLAITDELTGLYNRRYFLSRLNEELLRAFRFENMVSIIILDIDYFKNVNDNYGHLTGDMLLQGIASLLKQNTRVSDIAARFGGEEFIILTPETTLAGTQKLAEKLRSAIAAARFQTDTGKEISITASFGCASVLPVRNKAGLDAVRLISMADKALYTAKSEGRNRVVCAGREETPAGFCYWPGTSLAS